MSQWSVVFEAFATGFPVLISHFVIAVLILIAGVLIYVKTSSWDDLGLVRSGNLAASISLGGAFVSLSIPLSASLTASLSIPSIFVWGVTAVVIQLICDRLAGLVIGDLGSKIEKNDLAAAFFVLGIKVSVALINSAVISG
jgi:putative membrane protein